MSGSQWPEVAKAVDDGLFVLAEAACLESRRPLQHGDRLRPAGLGPSGQEAAQGRTPRARKRARPGGRMSGYLLQDTRQVQLEAWAVNIYDR